MKYILLALIISLIPLMIGDMLDQSHIFGSYPNIMIVIFSTMITGMIIGIGFLFKLAEVKLKKKVKSDKLEDVKK